MNKKYYYLLSISIIMCLFFVGCGKTEDAAITQTPEPTVTDAPENVPEQETVPEVAVADDAISEDASADAGPSDNTIAENPEEAKKPEEAEKPEGSEGEGASDNKDSDSLRTIVWLGDSLTQGSLGDDNDNLANAPYVKLQSLVPNKVEGYGLYGYNTHDIFWVYKDADHYHQTVDPDKIYIFWVGSNDWCPMDGENTNTAPVIAEIDSFLQSGGVKDYIVMGTTQRWRLGLERAQIINADLSAHYGSHYMEVLDIIAKNGFSEDNTHLSQASYDAIAEAVYGKLKALGYI